MSADETIKFLGWMWGSSPGMWSTLSYRPRPGADLVHAAVRTDDLETWACWFDLHREVDCYFRVCPMDDKPAPGKRGEAIATSAVPGAFADLDWCSEKHPGAPERELVLKRAQELHQYVPLSTVVDTGNGLQVYAMFDEPTDPVFGKQLLTRWDQQLSARFELANDCGSNLASLLRLPGTHNTSGDHTVRIARSESARVHAVGDLDDLFPPLTAAKLAELEAGYSEAGYATGVEVAEFLDRYTDENYLRALATAIDGMDGTMERTGGNRHKTLRMFLWQVLREAKVGAYPARRAVEDGHAAWKSRYVDGTDRPPQPHELRDWLRSQIPRVEACTEDDLAEVRARLAKTFPEAMFQNNNTPPPGVDPRTGEVRDDPVRLPDDFWTPPLHAAVRDAAELVGVSAEGLMLTVLLLVLAHVPRSVTLPGPRIGTVNALGCLVGHPGARKGTTFDRAMELLPPPPAARLHLLGTAQGFVKEFFRPTTKAERDADPKLGNYLRHHDPVIIRTDEIATFASSTRKGSDNGERLLGELKRAVSGEELGSGYATDDKNLRVDALSYRVVGMLAVAPLKAEDLFADLGGGMPERFLFAAAAPTHSTPIIDPGPFVPGVDTGQVPAGAHAKLPPLGWQLPLARRAWLVDSPDVSDWLYRSALHRQAHGCNPLDVHGDYLRHMIAAGIALFGGSWDIDGDAFARAGMILDVSVATRTQLLDTITAERRRGGHERVAQQRAAALDTDAALAEQRAERLWITERSVKIARQVIADPGVNVRTLRERVDGTRRAWWDAALQEAKVEGFVVEREEPVQGGAARRLYPGSEAPA